MKQTTSFHEKSAKPEGHETLKVVVAEIANVLMLPHEVKMRANAISLESKAGGFGQRTPIHVLGAAMLYIACREKKRPITLRELAEASGTDAREVGKCYLEILENMHISRPSLNGKGYVYRIALKKPVSEQVISLSQEIINRMSSSCIGGRNPMTIAAASLYLACCSMGENVTQAEVAEAAGVGEQSVRDCCKEVRNLMKPPPV